MKKYLTQEDIDMNPLLAGIAIGELITIGEDSEDITQDGYYDKDGVFHPGKPPLTED